MDTNNDTTTTTAAPTTTTTETEPTSAEMLLEGVDEIGMGEKSRLMLLDTDAAKTEGDAGTPVRDLNVTSLRLVKLVIDDSASIANAGNTEAIMIGADAMVKQFRQEEASGERVLISMSILNRGVVYPFVRPNDAKLLSEVGYSPVGTTPLHDALVESVAEITMKVGEAAGEGAVCYSSIIVLTDGEDYGSKRSASECAEVLSDYRRNDRNQIQAIGVKVQGSPNYQTYLPAIGLDPKYIHESSTDPADISAKCKRASRLSVQAVKPAATQAA